MNALVLSFLMTAAPTADVTLPPELAAQCAKEDGCKVVSVQFLRELVQAAIKAGSQTCRKDYI